MLFHVEKQTEYFVEANGVRSPAFTMTVLDLPTVENLVLEYHFPAYTGMEPRTVDPGGDIAAIQGTEVRLKVSPTMTTGGGRVMLNENESAPLTVSPDGTLAGNFTVGKQGFYRIELDGPQGEKVAASPQYTIDVLADQAPTVHFSKPGRDTQATPVEEVFAEVKADDDFGVKQVQMFYSVNGGAEKTISLFGGAQHAARSHGQPHDLPRGARPEAGRLRVVLRQGQRQRRRAGREDDDERHLLRADPAVPEGLHARRSPWRAAVAAAAAATRSASSRSSSGRSSRRRSTSFATSRR